MSNNKKSTNKPKFRKQLVDHALEYKNITKTAEKFNTTRNTVAKWVKRFKELGVEGLETSSKKNWSHKNKTSDLVINKIINYKKENPDTTFSGIKKALSLDCNRSTITRILDKAKLSTNTKIKREISKEKLITLKSTLNQVLEPFSAILFSYKKLNTNRTLTDEDQDFPKYLFLAHDLKSELLFLGFSESLGELEQAVFINYIMENLKQSGVDTKKTTIHSIHNNIVTEDFTNRILKVKLNFKVNKEALSENLKSLSNTLTLNVSHQINKFASIKNISNIGLLEKSFSYLLLYNTFKKKLLLNNKTSKEVLFGSNIINNNQLENNYSQKILSVSPIEVKFSRDSILKNSKKDISYIELFQDDIEKIKANTIILLDKNKSNIKQNRYYNSKMYNILENQLLIADDKKLKRVYLKDKLRLLKNIGHWDQAISSYKKILRNFKKKYSDSEEDKIPFLLDYAAYLALKLQREEAIKLNKKALKLALKYDDDESIIISKIHIAQQLMNLNKLDKVKKYIDDIKLFIKSNKTNDELMLIRFYSLLSKYYYEQKRYKICIFECKKALTIAKKINNTDKVYQLYSNLSLYCNLNKEFDKSLNYANKQLELAENENSITKLINTYGNLANLYFEICDFKKAKYYYLKELNVEKNIEKYPLRKIQAIIGLINIGLKKDNYIGLEKYCLDLITFTKEKNSTYYLSDAYYLLGQIYVGLKRNEEAKETFKKAKKLYKSLNELEKLDSIIIIIKELDK